MYRLFYLCYIQSFIWKDYSDNSVVCSQKVYDVEGPHSEYGFIQRWQTYNLHTVSKLPINKLYASFCILENYKCIVNWTAAVFLATLHLLWNDFTDKNKADMYIPYYCTHPGSSVLRRLWWVMGNPLSDFSCTFGNCNTRHKPTIYGQVTELQVQATENIISLLCQPKT